jgi:hypothetical protein
MFYSMRNVGNEIEIECVNGGIGSDKPRRVKLLGPMTNELLELLAKRLCLRGHTSPASYVYDDINYGESLPAELTDGEMFDRNRVEMLFESDRDVVTLTGFASVLCDSQVLKTKRVK